jgi:hypothetical protein
MSESQVTIIIGCAIVHKAICGDKGLKLVEYRSNSQRGPEDEIGYNSLSVFIDEAGAIKHI